MIISRVKTGLFIIGASVLLFGFNIWLSDETANQITVLAPVQNFLFLLSFVLMSIGIYFISSSKPCPACGRKGP